MCLFVHISFLFFKKIYEKILVVLTFSVSLQDPSNWTSNQTKDSHSMLRIYIVPNKANMQVLVIQTKHILLYFF